MGGHQKLGRPLGRRNHRRDFPEGVRDLSLLGTSRHRRHGVRGTRDAARSEGRHRRGRARHHRVFGIVVAVTLLFAACDRGRDHVARAATVPEEINFTSLDSPSLQYLPRGQEAHGWQLQEDPIVVPAKQLVNYLDRDGARFAHYEALDVTSGKYRALGPQAVFAIVEIFRFPDFVRALGAWSTSKTDTRKPLQVANA